MKFFVISRHIYPIPVGDAEDGYVTLDDEESSFILDAWSRGMILSQSGKVIDDFEKVNAVVQTWSTDIANHAYFRRKNAEAVERALNDKAEFVKKLADVKLPKVKIPSFMGVVDVVS